MNMKSIYANPYKYAIKCHIPFELAKIACLKQRHLEKDQKKHPCRCPVCKSKDLIYNDASYEECYGEFIECNTCGETFNCNEVPNIEYANFTGWEDFDAVLYFSNTENKEDGWREACGATTHNEWIKFAAKMILGERQMSNINHFMLS